MATIKLNVNNCHKSHQKLDENIYDDTEISQRMECYIFIKEKSFLFNSKNIKGKLRIKTKQT